MPLATTRPRFPVAPGSSRLLPRGPAGPRSPCGLLGSPRGTRVRRLKVPARIGSTLSRIGGAHAAEAATRQLSSRQPHEADVGRNGTRAVDLPNRPAPTRPPVRAPVPATLGVGSKRPVTAGDARIMRPAHWCGDTRGAILRTLALAIFARMVNRVFLDRCHPGACPRDPAIPERPRLAMAHTCAAGNALRPGSRQRVPG